MLAHKLLQEITERALSNLSRRILERLACEVLERHGQCERVMLVGIERRGADLAEFCGLLDDNATALFGAWGDADG